MEELFHGRLAPITHSMGFIKRPCADVVQGFLDWQRPIQNSRGVSIEVQTIDGNFEYCLKQLLPLTSVERRRFLFLPTKSEWTAFFDNGHQGSDVFTPLSFLAENLKCDAVRSTYISENSKKGWPAIIFELYGPEEADFLNYKRSISLAFDGKKWSFSDSGEVQYYENTKQYTASSLKERFNFETLDKYLRSIGIMAFDSNYYGLSESPSILVEKFGATAIGLQEFGL